MAYNLKQFEVLWSIHDNPYGLSNSDTHALASIVYREYPQYTGIVVYTIDDANGEYRGLPTWKSNPDMDKFIEESFIPFAGLRDLLNG